MEYLKLFIILQIRNCNDSLFFTCPKYKRHLLLMKKKLILYFFFKIIKMMSPKAFILFLFFSSSLSVDLRACIEPEVTQDRLGLVAVAHYELGKPVSYTQDWPDRWSGIRNWICPFRDFDNYPPYADCSSFVTWIYWVVFGMGDDFVNDRDWSEGYTGTMSDKGTTVTLEQARPGDIVLYGPPSHSHVTLYIGDGKVISFGGSSPPQIYDIDYYLWDPRNKIISFFEGCLSDNECVNHVEGGETICFNGGYEITPSSNGYCTTGCHSDWDCPEGKHCDTSLTTWQCVEDESSEDCYGPDSAIISDGDSKIYYLYNDPCVYGCDDYEYRYCDDGVLSGSYTYSSCSTEGCSKDPDDCYTPSGSIMIDGEDRIFYSRSSVPCGGNCYDYSEYRLCRDGILSGSYTYSSCHTEDCTSKPYTPPTSTPYTPPPPTPEENNCFASDSFVNILYDFKTCTERHGEHCRTYNDELQIPVIRKPLSEVLKGDIIETNNGKFSKVYHIKHHPSSPLLKFYLQEVNGNCGNILEITPNHLVYTIAGEVDEVAAKNIKVGDYLQGKQIWRVEKIEITEKPSTFILTQDYDIFVNNVKCSVFTTNMWGQFGSVLLVYANQILPEFIVNVLDSE